MTHRIITPYLSSKWLHRLTLESDLASEEQKKTVYKNQTRGIDQGNYLGCLDCLNLITFILKITGLLCSLGDRKKQHQWHWRQEEV